MDGKHPNADFFARLNTQTDQATAQANGMGQMFGTLWKALVAEGVPEDMATTITWQFHRTYVWKPDAPPTAPE